jgi:hypothetical protein
MLPWLQEQSKREPASVEHLQDCGPCKQRYPSEVRRDMGCAYEPDQERTFMWRHIGDSGPKPTTCAGYTTKLPMVREVAASYIHWEKGTLEQRFRGHELPEPLLDALEILHVNVSEVQSWDLKRRADK